MTRAFFLPGLLTAVLLAGCATRVPVLEGPAPAGTAEVRAGDRVAIQIPEERDLSGTFTVAYNGEVTVPRLGQVRAAGVPVTTLQDSLRTSLSRFFRNTPEVVVLRRISVVGAVRKPDLYMVDLTMSLRDVLATAGGVHEGADPRRVFIVREGRRFRVPGEAGSFPAASLQSGDQVVVGGQSWIARNYTTVASTAVPLIYLMLQLADRFGRDDNGAP